MDLFVYYDVATDAAAGLASRIRAMFDELGVPARLMRRADASPRATWMEVYADVAPGFEARLAAAVERHELAGSTGPRRIERFVDLA